ncbi:MAG: ABC transporter ATP-binding protein [Clostridia bacterium]|nr:ABC transporter ATP-binding protein [Clostridia bacterium]
MISIRNLDFIYQKSKKHAIRNISFDIEKGEIFGFLGPSGAGKTTTQRLIIGLIRGYQGDIMISGKERRQWKKDFFENIGVAFDFPNLYLKLTAKENLELIGSYYKNEKTDIDKLLDEVGLLKDKNVKIEDYSKGMKMRLNFVRSIMHNPDILFFDEPTSGLDPVNAKIIKDKIVKLKEQNKTVFLTTHNMTVAEQLCDRVAFINEGEISAIDTPKNLMIENGRAFIDMTYLVDGIMQNAVFPLSGIESNEKFYDIMKKHQIMTMHTQEATLEDVFIKYTGRNLI